MQEFLKVAMIITDVRRTCEPSGRCSTTIVAANGLQPNKAINVLRFETNQDRERTCRTTMNLE